MKPSAADLVRDHREAANQVPALTGYNLFLTDKTLVRAAEREAPWAHSRLSELGRLLGAEETQRWGFDANENRPALHTHDQTGNRRDEVVFHPAWHNLMRTSIAHQVHSLSWTEKRPGAHVARAILMMLTAQNELGHTCPISMTFSGVAALQPEPDVARAWTAKALSAVYDPAFRPIAEKTGGLLGMGMTEKQGGSDVRANTTLAEQTGASREYLITGHKWFCSAPMCDAFLILAQTPKGLTCFLLPRWQPDGARNRFYLQRLKDKMGNRSNASSEVEFDRAWAQRIGEEGRGVHTIIEMVNHTRLDCAIAAAALMRQGVVQAMHHARHRAAFGKLLIEQPLMRNVLADLSIESQAATLLMVRLAQAFDAREADPAERAFARVATAIAKYWLCKRAPMHVGESLECLGGNGYVEESIMPRLYREAPLYSIWEGSGNVICLDILRALSKEPGAADAIMAELRKTANSHQGFDRFIADVETSMLLAKSGTHPQGEGRRLAEKLALALQASLLIRHGSPAVADAFILSRLDGEHGHAFGTLPSAGLNGIFAEMA